MKKFTSITAIVLIFLLGMASLVGCTQTITSISWPHYGSVEMLTRVATDIVRVEALGQTTERLNVMLPPSPPRYERHVVNRFRVLEVFQGDLQSGDIIEVVQGMDWPDGDRLRFRRRDDLVLFLTSFDDFTLQLLNPYEAAYRFPSSSESTQTLGREVELESVHDRNDLALTITIGDLVQLAESNFGHSMG